MQTKRSDTQLAFARLLRAFQTGGVCYDDLLNQLDQYVLQGANRSELLETLRHRESVEPLADDVYLAVWSRLRRVVREEPRADAPAPAARPMTRMPDTVSRAE
jgi:hypothetical protein